MAKKARREELGQERITITVDKEVHAKIEILAERMEVSTSRMASLLCDAALEDQAWIIKLVTTKMFKRLSKGMEMPEKPDIATL